MRNILLFEKYIESIYEVDLSDFHYSSRTSLNNINSRIVPYGPNNRFGYELKGFIDEKENFHNKPEEIVDLLGMDEKTMYNYISSILYLLTNSKKLKKWKSDNKSFYKMLNLGRICFKYTGKNYYPLIAGGRGLEDEDDFYDYGDRIWVLSKGGGIEDKAKTVKYYSGNIDGQKLMLNRSYRDAQRDNPKISKYEFINQLSSIENPYGKYFVALVDLDENDPMEDQDTILQSIKAKIER